MRPAGDFFFIQLSNTRNLQLQAIGKLWKNAEKKLQKIG